MMLMLMTNQFMTWHKMILIQADDCDAFKSNVDDEPTAQTIFMANLSSAVSSLQQAGPSNASILSEHNEESIVPSGASSVQYDDYMLHENSAYVLDDSFTKTLIIYKDQELLENVISSCPKTVNTRDRYNASTHAKRNKHVTFAEPLETSPNNTSTQVKQLNKLKTNVLAIPSTGVNSVTKASTSQSRSNTKIDRTLTAKSGHKKNVEDHLRNNKSDLHKKNRVDSGISFKRVVVNSNSNSHFKACCSKHMTGDRSRLRNFMKNFIRTVRFGNNDFGAIIENTHALSET
nr:integrase, catalytic region, zinc finger, CCHC-type, peptidase aspartic, catalytic [Tanacetum cinerariifolium]